MQKLTPGANKANAILIRIVLFLIGGIAIITGMCLFSGDMWMLTPRAEQYQPATGDLGNDSNLLIVFYVQIMPDDFVMQLHRF